MQYWKATDEYGFVSVSTVNTNGEGNSTKAEFIEITDLYRAAPDGYGVVKTEQGFEYAPYPRETEQELTNEETLEIILGGAV